MDLNFNIRKEMNGSNPTPDQGRGQQNIQERGGAIYNKPKIGV